MKGILRTVLEAPADQRLFLQGEQRITAGDVRELAAGAAPAMVKAGDTIFLHASRASLFLAGLLAAAALRKHIVLPAHAQPAYLAEIGCPPGALFSDAEFNTPRAGASKLSALDEDPLLTFLTSGSTGAPKPVRKNLSRIETEARALDALWGARAGHVVSTVSHQHIYGLLFRLAWPILSGRTADDEPAQFWEDLQTRLGGATLVSSPAHLNRLPPAEDFFIGKPALAFSSGQALPLDAAQNSARRFGAPVFEVLGSTETGGIAWRQQERADAPWTPFAPVTVSDAAGALSVHSPYLQDDAPIETGDGVEFLPDGRFRLQPRIDRIAKVDGKRVSLTRIEDALTALPEIAAAAALTLPDRRDQLAAIIVLSEAGKTAHESLGAFRLSRHLRRAASERLEPAERPKSWRFIDALPTDSQGKRVLSTLRALFDTPADPLQTLSIDVRAQNETDAEIAFTLAPDLIYFDGHFPGEPILPGVAQVHMAALFAERLWNAETAGSELARVKFRRVMVPGDDVLLKLNWNAKIGRVTFAYLVKDEEVSRGEIGGA